MKKELRLKKVWACCVMLLMTKFLFAQPGGYAWDRFGMGNVVMTNNSPVNGIISNTTQATSTTNYYLVQWDGYANKWSNTSTPYNQVFTLNWGGGSFNGPDGVFSTAPTSGRHYTLQIRGLSYSSRQGVIMETNNAPQSFHPTASTALSNPGVVCSGAAVTINVTLAGAKSPQERVFVRYSSTSNFATSKVVEATGTGSTWSTASATIPGADNTSGTIFYYAYTTTVAATDASDHDLITLRLGNNGGSNYSYTIAPTPGFVNLQFPGSVTICQGSDFNAFGQIFVAGRTEAPGAGSGIVAEVGYSSTNTNPNTWTNWIAAPYFGQGGLGNNNDEYRGTFGAALAPGTYYYAFRYQINGCTFFYGGFNAGGGGTWNGTSNNSGVLTITPSTTYYQDADGDGFGNPSVAQTTCSAPVGFVTNNSDCNDNQLRYADADGDGFGSTTLVACGGVVNNTDCNDNQLRYADNDGDSFGSTTFVACGGVLNNTDCDDNQLRYADNDGDGFGSTTFVACGGVLNNTDCNDALLTYVDADGDGFGTSTPAPCGATNTTDCNDGNAAVYVNGTFYVDADGDGFGASTAAPSTVCVANVSIAPTGFSVNNGDCNDANASIRPGAVDVCYDGIDNDCNGNIDNLGLPGGCTPIVSVIPTAVCGTEVAFGGIVYSSLVSGAQGYRYRVTEVNPADDSEIPGTQVIVDMVLRNLFLHNLSNYKYNAKFKVEIAVRFNNVWQPNYSAPCYLFTPTPTSTMIGCGTQITGINTQIFSTLVSRSTGYRYRVQRLDSSFQPVGTPQEIVSGIRNFRFSQVTDFRYDANYSVSCAVRNT
ncbi:MAG: putative metal-binding motif-containing protein, partial [Microcystis sp. LE19-338.1B]|nr:putative metal-binding motif-containing protein [Microcystis sp. LE19-338.1B]